MAVLFNRAVGLRVLLRAEHVFGRHPERSDTYVPDPEVSAIHAVARYQDGVWRIADHSLNGTFLDEKPLPKGKWTALSVGQTLRFGTATLSAWRVLDISAPATSLVPEDPSILPIALSRNNLLPSESEPEISIYEREAGRWMWESASEARELCDGDALQIAGVAYRLLVNAVVEATVTPSSSSSARSLRLRFHVSSDEERASLQVMHGPHNIDLGERCHHYFMVTLARRRMADAKAGLAADLQGWIGSAELAKLLRIEHQHLNIQVFRARNQLMSAVPNAPQLAQVVERRRGALRLGPFEFEIVRGGLSEARYRPDSGFPRPSWEQDHP